MESKSNLGLSISYYVTPETPILGGLLALPGVPAPTVCACAFNFVHFSHCLLFLQLSFDVVCQVEEERDGICGVGCCGGGSTAAKDKSKNLLCRSGRGVVRWLAGRREGVLVPSLFCPLCRRLQHRPLLNLLFYNLFTEVKQQIARGSRCVCPCLE